MTIETEIAGLTTATTDLLSAVNVRKAALEAKIAEAGAFAADALAKSNDAGNQASIANAHKVAAAASATAAAASATAAAAAKTAAETARDSAVAVVTGGTGSLKAAPGKLPLADGSGLLDLSWFAAILPSLRFNDIGVQGAQGFGVGICPSLPAGFSALSGTTDPASENYGNYQCSDGSVMVWIPAFWLRRGHAGNPTYATYGVNSVDVRPLSAFPDEATAAAQGYYLHRAFINAGKRQPGFFRDKYDCSLNGNIASSIKNRAPLVSASSAGQPTFSQCTANGQAPGNYYGGAIAAARSRGSQFFPETVFMADAISTLTEAHAQAATSATHCAWYDAAGVTNYPKGNNNGALKDANDAAVVFTGAGNATYPGYALAGSGAPFAKTTHNGQACGIADVNGNVWKINPGLTSILTTTAITGATKTNPVQITVPAHGRTTGETVGIFSVGGMTSLNDKYYRVTVIDASTLALDGVDGTGFADYTAGGLLHHARFYLLKPGADITALGWGASAAADHWGPAGAAANFDEVTLNFATTYPGNGLVQRFGNGANAVFDWSTLQGRARAMAGMPAAGGMSAAGTNAMGQDYYYQHMVNQLCVVSRGRWDSGAGAGVRARDLSNARAAAYSSVGFAASCYL